MRKLGAIAIAVLAWVNVANAGITDWSANDDGDGAILCPQCNNSFESNPDTLNLVGDQCWAPGHILGSFTTQTGLDQETVTMHNTIGNCTGSAWPYYTVNLSMDEPFTINSTDSPPVVNNLGGWSATVVDPVQEGSEWVGHVDYSCGTPLQSGGTFDCSYQIGFTGCVSWTQETVCVPEPSTLTGGRHGPCGSCRLRLALASPAGKRRRPGVVLSSCCGRLGAMPTLAWACRSPGNASMATQAWPWHPPPRRFRNGIY